MHLDIALIMLVGVLAVIAGAATSAAWILWQWKETIQRRYDELADTVIYGEDDDDDGDDDPETRPLVPIDEIRFSDKTK